MGDGAEGADLRRCYKVLAVNISFLDLACPMHYPVQPSKLGNRRGAVLATSSGNL